MILFSRRIRPAWHRAVCAMFLSCALVPAAKARQQSSAADATATKDPSAKSATSTHHNSTHHKTTSTAANRNPTHSTATRSPSGSHTASTGKRFSHKKIARARGQQKIDSERAEAIQEALIREHYLTGEPTGTWNQTSEDAMRKYQADHGWQTKEVPDSRALIKLGLGPSNDHLLNPESAMTTRPDAPKAASLPTTSHSTLATDPVPASSSPASAAAPSSEPAPTGSSSPAPASTPPASTPAANDPQRPQ
jgi:hypothetical protein